MNRTIQDEKYGEIVYEESFWAGSKQIIVNGKPLQKTSKKTFLLESKEVVTVKGNFMLGVTLLVGAYQIKVIPTIKWYEILLGILPFILVLVWGNVPALFAVVPVIGGAIGGAIGGGLSVFSAFTMKCVKPIWLKIIIGIAFLGATFGICCGIGYAILGSVS